MRIATVFACACGVGLGATAACALSPGSAAALLAPRARRVSAPGGTASSPPGASSSALTTPEPALSPTPTHAVPRPGLLVPVLMYHVIARPAANAPLKGLYVAPSLFAAQMRALRAAGYQAVTLGQAYASWRGTAPAPARPVVLTFDDGYVSVYENARPVLQSMHWPGVLCQQVQRIGFPGGFTPAQIRVMLASGWELADHAVTQPEVDLTTASASVIHFEVFSSRADLRTEFHTRVRFFCYPVGHYDPAVVAAVRAAGFSGAISTVFGAADPAVEGMYRLERIRVWAGESPQQLVAIVGQAARRAPPPPPSSFPEPPPESSGPAGPAGKPPLHPEPAAGPFPAAGVHPASRSAAAT